MTNSSKAAEVLLRWYKGNEAIIQTGDVVIREKIVSMGDIAVPGLSALAKHIVTQLMTYFGLASPVQQSNQSFCISMQGVFTRFTQETGPAVKVSPHSLRHMLSSYIDRLNLSETEKRSFAYVLHHSPETHEESYVYRDRAHLVNPAANRMAQLLSESFYISQ